MIPNTKAKDKILRAVKCPEDCPSCIEEWIVWLYIHNGGWANYILTKKLVKDINSFRYKPAYQFILSEADHKFITNIYKKMLKLSPITRKQYDTCCIVINKYQKQIKKTFPTMDLKKSLEPRYPIKQFEEKKTMRVTEEGIRIEFGFDPYIYQYLHAPYLDVLGVAVKKIGKGKFVVKLNDRTIGYLYSFFTKNWRDEKYLSEWQLDPTIIAWFTQIDNAIAQNVHCPMLKANGNEIEFSLVPDRAKEVYLKLGGNTLVAEFNLNDYFYATKNFIQLDDVLLNKLQDILGEDLLHKVQKAINNQDKSKKSKFNYFGEHEIEKIANASGMDAIVLWDFGQVDSMKKKIYPEANMEKVKNMLESNGKRVYHLKITYNKESRDDLSYVRDIVKNYDKILIVSNTHQFTANHDTETTNYFSDDARQVDTMSWNELIGKIKQKSHMILYI